MCSNRGQLADGRCRAATAWSRIRDDKHYLWNVVLGAGIAWYSTDAVLRHDDGIETTRSPWVPSLEGSLTPDSVGLDATWRF